MEAGHWSSGMILL